MYLLEVGAEEAAVEKCPARKPAEIMCVTLCTIIADVELALDDGVAFGGHGPAASSCSSFTCFHHASDCGETLAGRCPEYMIENDF